MFYSSLFYELFFQVSFQSSTLSLLLQCQTKKCLTYYSPRAIKTPRTVRICAISYRIISMISLTWNSSGTCTNLLVSWSLALLMASVRLQVATEHRDISLIKTVSADQISQYVVAVMNIFGCIFYSIRWSETNQMYLSFNLDFVK